MRRAVALLLLAAAASAQEAGRAPSAAADLVEKVATRVQRMLAERDQPAQLVPLPAATLRYALALAGGTAVDRAAAGFEKGLLLVAAEPASLICLYAFRDEDAAAHMERTWLANSKAEDLLFGKAGADPRIVSTTYRPVSIDGVDGVEVLRTFEANFGMRWRAGTVAVRDRAVVLEVTMTRLDGSHWQAARLAREALALLRGAEAADPWDGKSREEARRALLESLADPSWGVRWRATRNLARLPEDAEIGAALARMLRDPDGTVACAAFHALLGRGWLERAAEEDLRALAAHADFGVRLEFHREMADRETDEAARAERFLGALEDAHPVVRAFAFRGLDELGESGRIPWERSRAGIEDADADLRLAAIESLGWRNPPEARLVLLKAMRDEDPDVREAAVRRLTPWVDESPEVVDALIEALKDPSASVRRNAADELEEAGKLGDRAVPALVRLLDDPQVREDAARALGQIGIATEEALRKLRDALADSDPGVRFEAARALLRLGHDRAELARVFGETLRDGESWHRYGAAEELGELGDLARPYVVDLILALKDESTGLRSRAAEALGNLGAIAEQALPELDALAGKYSDEEEREEEEHAIGLGGVGSDESNVRRAARDAARKIRAALR